MLRKLCVGEGQDFRMLVHHTLGNTGNYVFDRDDHLRLCDYGDEHVSDLIRRRQLDFEQAMCDVREELRSLGI